MIRKLAGSSKQRDSSLVPLRFLHAKLAIASEEQRGLKNEACHRLLIAADLGLKAELALLIGDRFRGYWKVLPLTRIQGSAFAILVAV